MQEDTENVQRGGESLYYLAPKCLYRGEYKRGMKCGALLRMSVVLSRHPRSIPESLLL